MQAPAECAIPEMDQANFSHGFEKLFPAHPIDFKIDVDRNRPVMRSRNVNELVRRSGHRGEVKIEVAGEVDR